MKVQLRTIGSLEDALTHAPRLDGYAAEFMAQFSDEPYPAGSVERFLLEHFGEPEALLTVAVDESLDRIVGLCLVGPLVDPLLQARTPLVLVLHVEPDYRHRGLASELIDEVRAVLRARGIQRLAGRVGHNDDALISMCERWGFLRHWDLMLHE